MSDDVDLDLDRGTQPGDPPVTGPDMRPECCPCHELPMSCPMSHVNTMGSGDTVIFRWLGNGNNELSNDTSSRGSQAWSVSLCHIKSVQVRPGQLLTSTAPSCHQGRVLHILDCAA